MVRRSFIPLIVLALGIAATPAFPQQSPAISQPDARQVADTIENQWMTNYNAGNAAGIGRMFAADGTYATAAGSVLSGPQAIEKALAARIKLGWTKVTTTVSEAHTAGNAVWIFGEYSIVGSGQNSGKQISGRYVKVLTQDGADWRIRMLISNLTPPAGQGTTTVPPSTMGSPR